jgi:glycosyltransferase involved in cell wall biosynthesis
MLYRSDKEMSSPAISVVMAVYNGQSFLQEALDSISVQTFTNYEFLIVNDGSTDKTENILDRYRRSDPRVKVFNNSHCGLVAALNFGCQLAKGEYIARIDADDISVPQRFERQIEFLNQNRQVAVLAGAMGLIGKDNTQIYQPDISDSKPLSDTEIKTMLKSHNCIGHNTVMMRTSSFHEIGGYRITFLDAEDYDLWLRLSEKYEMAVLPEVLTYYRLHVNQVSVRKNEQQVISVLAAQAASRIRLATGLDPISSEDRATRLLLKKLGVMDETVNDMIIASYLRIFSFVPTDLSLVSVEDKPIVAELAAGALTFCDSVVETNERAQQLQSLAERLLAGCLHSAAV